MPFEVEHISPSARGGADDESNLALACRSCNLHKSDHVMGVDSETGAAVGLFDPRADHWADHFSDDFESGEIRGLTTVGRATVERLRLNEPVQLAARQLWIGLRLFP